MELKFDSDANIGEDEMKEAMRAAEETFDMVYKDIEKGEQDAIDSLSFIEYYYASKISDKLKVYIYQRINNRLHDYRLKKNLMKYGDYIKLNFYELVFDRDLNNEALDLCSLIKEKKDDGIHNVADIYTFIHNMLVIYS